MRTGSPVVKVLEYWLKGCKSLDHQIVTSGPLIKAFNPLLKAMNVNAIICEL